MRKHGPPRNEGPPRKRRRTTDNLPQSTLETLVAGTITWVEEDTNRLFKTKGKGPNALAMAKRWKEAMMNTVYGDPPDLSTWTDEAALYKFVAVSKEVARLQQEVEKVHLAPYTVG